MAKAAGLGVALGRARALGAAERAPARASTWRSATAPTTSRVAAALLRIPSATMFDYEWATRAAPRQLPPGARGRRARRDPAGAAGAATARAARSRAYEGLKEEYYLADFEPDAAVLDELGLDATRPIVVVRTPPEVSLYHRFENDLFARVLRRLREAAAAAACRRWCCRASTPSARELARVPGFVVPERAIDAQSLIAYADLVISAGGTMNREAVALGTPVWTTFEGRLGAVDERLIAEGRLRRLRGPGRARAASARSRARADATRVRRDPRVLVDAVAERQLSD